MKHLFTLIILIQTLFISDLLAWRDLETGAYFTRDPAGFVDGPNMYAYVRQNPWSSFDPTGLITVLIYDGKDKGHLQGLAGGPHFRAHAKRSRADIKIDAQSLDSAYKQLKNKKAKYQAALATSITNKNNEIENAKTTRNYKGRGQPANPPDIAELENELRSLKDKAGEEITKLFIEDHGSPGGQTLGDDNIEIFSQSFIGITEMMDKDGVIYFGGCECAKGEEGEGLVEDAAVISNRKVRANTTKPFLTREGKQIRDGSPYVWGDPSKIVEPSAGAHWSSILWSYKQAINNAENAKNDYDVSTTGISSPTTGEIPDHIEERMETATQ